jgi:receptor protein-tyrosine kinase
MSKIEKAIRKIKLARDQTGDKQAGNRREQKRVRAIALTEQSITSDFPEHNHGKIVEVDQEVLRDAGLIAPEYHEKMLADQFREIKRPLIASAYGKRVARVEDGNLIMISSAMPGEGKTFTSINLALSIAQEQDLTVLLVDADVAKPQISEIFGVSEVPGLLDILEGQPQAPEALVIRTNIEGLSFLPAGALRDNATELLSGSRMDDVVQQLATRFPQRVIVFDTPPLLQTSEAKVLVNLAGQVVLVVKAESTPQGAVAEALHILGGEKAVSLVLNQSRTAGEKDRYKYGYGYGFD